MSLMKHLFFGIISSIAVLCGCGKEMPTQPKEEEHETQQATEQETVEPQSQDKKVLVAYFSFTGTTKAVATLIASISGGTLHMIEPETAYGSENNTYYDQSTRAYKEQYGPATARPAIKKTLENAGNYDVVLLGFPIWYGKAPRVVFTFLDSYSFKGKTVIPFITSGSTGISSAALELKSAYPDITWKTGDRLNGKTTDQLTDWLKTVGVKVK